MAQAIECLPSKHEDLNSNPTTTKKEKEKNMGIYRAHGPHFENHFNKGSVRKIPND
jgi:hypothetical protein